MLGIQQGTGSSADHSGTYSMAATSSGLSLIGVSLFICIVLISLGHLSIFYTRFLIFNARRRGSFPNPAFGLFAVSGHRCAFTLVVCPAVWPSCLIPVSFFADLLGSRFCQINCFTFKLLFLSLLFLASLHGQERPWAADVGLPCAPGSGVPAA